MPSVTCGLCCLLLAWTWQFFIVSKQGNGNWTVLFNTGNEFVPPSELVSEHIRVFDHTGYDGQFYHYVAHDPFMRNDWRRHFDFYSFRYGRALVPLMAYATALGRSQYIDAAYIAATLFFVGLGSYWVSIHAVRHGYHWATGLLFLLLPATLVSIENLTVDVALSALAAGLFVHQLTPMRSAALVMLAPLVRETGAILLLASGAAAFVRRNWRAVVVVCAAAIPFVAWMAFVRVRGGPVEYPAQVTPFTGTLYALALTISQVAENTGRRLPAALELFALAGSIAAIGLGISRIRRTTVIDLGCVGFALLAVVQQHPDTWVNYHAYGRILSPLMLWLGMIGLSERKHILFLPAVLILPRLLFPSLARVANLFS